MLSLLSVELTNFYHRITYASTKQHFFSFFFWFSANFCQIFRPCFSLFFFMSLLSLSNSLQWHGISGAIYSYHTIQVPYISYISLFCHPPCYLIWSLRLYEQDEQNNFRWHQLLFCTRQTFIMSFTYIRPDFLAILSLPNTKRKLM